MKLEKYLLLNWKKFLIVVGAFIAAVVLHNLFYAIFGFEEAVFFTIATVIIPLYLIFAISCTIYHGMSTKK